MNNGDMPASPFEGPTEFYGGFTKREALSAIAMQGIIASGNVPTSGPVEMVMGVTRGALDYADAMLKAWEIDSE